MASVSSEFLSVDPYLKNAFSSAVNFDISHKRDDGEGQQNCVDLMSVHRAPAQEWEVDVRQQMSSQKWLQNHGLRKLRLQMTQILEIIGFKLCDDYDPSLKRPVSSRYGQGLFEQITAEDGKTFNIACDRDKLLQLRRWLMQAMALYRRRLEWLTSESRRVFGVVEEKAVTVVMDVRNMSPEQFDQYRAALDRVMREQFHHVTKFNLIRAAEDLQLYSEECIPCSHGTVEAAIHWMWALDRLAPVSNTACAEAVLKALLDRHNEAVYLFTEGTSIDCGRELVLEKVRNVERKIPVHVVSFNCNSSDTIKFLRNFATVTGGRFHAYAVLMETDAYDPSPTTADPFASKANVLLKRKTFGGVAPGAGVRPDVGLLFEEIEEARTNLQQLEILIDRMPEPSKALTVAEKVKAEKTAAEEKDEQYMSSKQWLSVYGINARKLSLQDVLASVAFRHQDGVVEVLEKPTNDQTDAVGQEKLINARYCEKFPVVRWKDDRVVHVQVTPEVHRSYEQRMHVVLKAIQQRIDWLKQGSRALFGTVVEEEVYILIDTSASMQHSIQFVKERLLVLMQEQLRHKAKFNLIAFNSKVSGWRDLLMEVSEQSLQSAWKWVQGLSCWGSTNTYAALQAALSDTHTQAIYLLTDGRPDQMAKSILTQVRMQNRVPIHTISFNCEDSDANQFLYDLAQITEGRYHCYTPHGTSGPRPDTWQSEDIKLLEDELGRGLEYLDQMAELRDQCASMAWKTEIDALKTCSKGHAAPDTPSRVSAAPPLEARDLFRPSSAPLQSPHPAQARPSSAVGFRPSRPQGAPKRPQSAKSHRGRKLVAGHTRTSLMRTLNSSGRFTPSEWLLPETAQLFEQQSDRQRQLAELSEQTAKYRKRRHKLAKTHASSSKQWLKKHGLVARRLTILDALAPTLVPHRSTYVPVLDKRVMARVFDEIMPIAHVSGRQRSKVTLVNPNAVNLTEYEERLEKAITQYRRRLNTLVWNALPESVKEEFESKEPASFEENRTKFLKALEEVEWPNAQADIKALEKEIAKGHKFLQQSKDLHQAAKEGDAEAASDAASEASAAPSVKESVDEEDEQEEEEVEEEEAASESVDRVLHVRDDEILTAPTTPRIGVDAPTPHPPSTPSPRSQDAQTPRSPSNPTPRSQSTHTPRPPDTATPRSAGSYTPRKVVTAKEQRGRGVGRSGGKDLKTSNKDEVGRKSAGRGRVMVSMLRGTKVIARNHADGLYYPGKVVKCPSVRRATVEFTDGQCDVLTRFILPVGGAVACPPLSVGDYALVQVMNMTLATECYVPSIVQFTPQRRQTQMQFYTVMLYNGQKVTTRRSHLVKISKERFELSARYITNVQGEDRNRVEANVYISERRKTEEDKLRRNRDRQQDSSRSRSRSSSPPSRPRSPTPGGGHRDSSRLSKSHRRERKIVDRDSKLEKEIKKKSRSGSRSRSGSSRSSVDVAQEEDMEGRSRSRSGSDSRPESLATDRQRELKRLKKQLKEQRHKQAKKRKRLKRKVKEMSNIQTRLLKTILDNHKEEEEQKKEEEEAQEPEEEEVPIVTPRMMRLRRSMPELRPAEEVLARFSDDGWYYRDSSEGAYSSGHEFIPSSSEEEDTDNSALYLPQLSSSSTVQQNLGDLSYIVEDATGYMERIWREDIISDYDDNAPPLKENDRVVAQHPQHSGSYAPGSVLSFDDVLQMVTIQFYDGQEGAVPRAEVYRLPLEKYNHDVLHIQQCQRSMLGLSVVARDDDSGEYFPGQIVDVKEGGQGYVIRWSDGSQAEQLPVHIFSAVTRRPRLLIGDRVLAVANPEQVVFLPGQIIGAQERSMVVRFCDGQVRDDVIPLFSYWLSSGYCEEASYFWKLHQPHFGKRQMYHA